ncbi:hypothetical protein CEXT_712501 [Caerostris extrusa]|uniref:Uncharacterized protein n=1 Tax=Caerostris extrusa TaxID=172846 RepID=A0AAV4R6K3_CAEEX|nr:hypothetical protein CEXT_712501 [Caerostris extrusa]
MDAASALVDKSKDHSSWVNLQGIIGNSDLSGKLDIKSPDHSFWSKPPRDYRNLDLSGKLDVYPPGAVLVVLREEGCTMLLAIPANIPYEGIPCPDHD